MICSTGLDLLQSSGEIQCAICRTGEGSNSIIYKRCMHWVYNSARGSRTFKRTKTTGTLDCPTHGLKTTGGGLGCIWQTRAIASVCYLWDILTAAGGCELSTTTRVKTEWKKFNELLPVLSIRYLSYKTLGRVYCSCFRNAMLHASETRSLTKPDLHLCSATTQPWSARSAIKTVCDM